MKKILNVFLVLAFSFIFMSNVFASANVNIKSLEISDKTSTINVNSYSYEGLGIKTDIFFNQVGDYVKFKVVLKNNDNIDYIISDIKSNYQNEYTDIVYEYENNSKDFRANSEKALFVTFKYTKEATDITVLNGTEIKLTIPLDTISNPKTGIEDVSKILLVGLGIGLSVFLLVRRSPKMLVVLFAFTLIGSTIYLTNAAQQLQIDLNVEVTMDAPTTGKAIFDRGVIVDAKAFELAGIPYITFDNGIGLNCKKSDKIGINTNNNIVRTEAAGPYLTPEISEDYYSCTNKILNYKRSKTIEDKYKTDEYKVSSSESEIPIYMWYEEGTKTIYWYSEAPIVYFNEDAGLMFSGLAYISNLDLSDIRSKYTKNFTETFSNMYSLKSIDVSKFDTSNVESIERMFYSDTSIESLDLSNWNTSKFNSIYGAFNGMISLKELDISSFEISHNTYLEPYNMFMLPSIEKIKTPKIINIGNEEILLPSLFTDNKNEFDSIKSTTPKSTWIYSTNLVDFLIIDYSVCKNNTSDENALAEESSCEPEKIMFKAEKGMTISDWVKSKYNTKNFKVRNSEESCGQYFLSYSGNLKEPKRLLASEIKKLDEREYYIIYQNDIYSNSTYSCPK